MEDTTPAAGHCDTSLTLTGSPLFGRGEATHANAVRITHFQALFTGPPGREPKAYAAANAPLTGIAADLCESLGRASCGLVAGQHPVHHLCLFGLSDIPGAPMRILAFLAGDTDARALNQAFHWLDELDTRTAPKEAGV